MPEASCTMSFKYLLMFNPLSDPFIAEVAKAQRSRDLPTVAHLVSGRAGL